MFCISWGSLLYINFSNKSYFLTSMLLSILKVPNAESSEEKDSSSKDWFAPLVSNKALYQANLWNSEG